MLSRYSVKRPMTVFVAVIVVIILGVVAFTGMTTDLLPNMDLPYVVVMTTYPGASPEKVESSVTRPLEQTLATTSGVLNISSVSNENYSLVVMEFDASVNMDSVMIEMSGSLDTVKAGFEDGVGAPVMMKINPDALPLMMLSVDMEGKDIGEVTQYVQDELLPAFERIDGVASVTATGLIEEELQIHLDQEKIDDINDRVLQSVDEELYNTKLELDEARAELEEGKSELESQSTDQTQKLADASVELADAKAQLQTALNTITSLEMENAQLKAQQQSLSQGVTQLEEAIAQLDASIAQMEAMEGLGLSAVGEESRMLAAGETSPSQEPEPTPDATPAATPLPDATPEPTEMPQETAAPTPTVPGEIPTLPPGTPTLDELRAQRSQLQTQLEETRNQLNTVTRELAVNEQTLAAMPMSKAEIESALAQLTAQQKQLEAGQQTLTSELTQAAMQIADGEVELDQATEEFEKARDAAYEAADISGVLTGDMISGILTAENFSMPAGYVTYQNEDHLIKVGNAFTSVEELENLLLFHVDVEEVGDVYLRDVATLEIADNAGEQYARVNGRDGIILSFQKQSTMSTAEVSERIQAVVQELSQQEAGLHITTLMDQGVYINLITSSVLSNLLYGGLLAILLLVFFLKDYKPTLIIALSIPISLMFAVVLMYFSGITLNVISLSGLALGVGMLVDNSIVVIENIYRLRSQGVSAAKAAVQGASEVAGAIFSSTLTTVCVFLPLVFTQGLTRQLFTDMALTITYSLMASLLVALTLVPSMASKMLVHTRERSHRMMEGFLNGYEKVLRFCLRYKPVVLTFSLVLLVVCGYMALQMGTSLMPSMDSTQMTASLSMPEGSSRDETLAMSDAFIERVLALEEVETVGALEGGSGMMLGGMGSSSGDGMSFYIILREDKTHSNEEIAQMIRDATADMDCELSVQASAMDMTSVLGSGIELVIKGGDLDTLQSIAVDMESILRDTEGVLEISTGLEDAPAETRIVVDKNKAMEYGLTVAQVYQEIAQAIQTETTATTLEVQDASYPVVLVREGVGKEDLADYVLTGTQNGEELSVRLKNIATISEAQGMTSIRRENQVRCLSVTASLDAEHNIGLVSRELEKTLDTYELPDGYTLEIAGESQQIDSAINDLLLMILLGIALIYLIMVAQFRSLMSPFIVMFTIPLAFTGGLLALWITGTEISIIAMVGFLLLTGVVVNNGIVFVDCVNQLRLAGMEKREALVQAGRLRMRPILMKALTSVLAMLTMALGVGMGADMSQPMAITTIGGLTYATLLTLLVVPVLYDIFQRRPLREVDLEETSHGD